MKAKIEIESVVEDLDDAGLTSSSDKTKSSAVGDMTITDNNILVSYTESAEGVTTVSQITSDEECVTVKRSGGVEYEFIFSEGKKTSSLYSVPPYSFDTEIYTRKIRKEFGECGGKISLIYDMTIGGAKKKTRMTIRISKL